MSIIRADSIKNRAGTGAPDFPNGITVTGIVTSTDLQNNITGDLTISGNLGVGGTVTYEDVTNVDSIGIITARSGIQIGAGGTIGSSGGGIVTYFGDGGQLTGIDASSLKNGSDIKVQANASGAVVTGVLTTTAYRPGEIIETLTGMCDGRTLVGLSTSITLSDITSYQDIDSDSYTDINGSVISYIPPIGTKTLVYRFVFHKATPGSGSGINSFKIFIDDTTVTYSKKTFAGDHSTGHNHMSCIMEWVFKLNASSTTVGDGYYTTADWVTAQQAKIIKIKGRRYNSQYESRVHYNKYWDGSTASGADAVVQPSIFIQAIG